MSATSQAGIAILVVFVFGVIMWGMVAAIVDDWRLNGRGGCGDDCCHEMEGGDDDDWEWPASD